MAVQILTDEPYIARPGSPGIIPIYNPADSAAQHANTKAQWEINEKLYRDPITMDSALIARFISLIEPAWQMEFSKKKISEPNMTFLACFKWFFDKYAKSNEYDCEKNIELRCRGASKTIGSPSRTRWRTA